MRVELQGRLRGFWADIQTNCPYAIKEDFQSGDLVRIWDAFGGLILNWNLTDTDGILLDLPINWARLRVEVPDEVLGELWRGYNAKITEAAQLPLA